MFFILIDDSDNFCKFRMESVDLLGPEVLWKNYKLNQNLETDVDTTFLSNLLLCSRLAMSLICIHIRMRFSNTAKAMLVALH